MISYNWKRQLIIFIILTMNKPRPSKLSLLAFLALLPTCLAIVCPAGLDSVPPRHPLGICVVLGCERAIKDQLCTSSCVEGFSKTSQQTCEVIKCASESKTSCSQCEPGYQLQAHIANPVLRVCVPSSCQKINKETRQCIQCQDGYQINKNKTCSLINCQNPDSSQTSCLKCRDKYILTPVQPGLNVCAPSNCVEYAPLTYQCLKCQPTYSITSEGACQLGLENCADFSEFSGLCYQCNQGYRLIGFGACVKEIDNCLQYNAQGCVSCKVQYQAIQGQCQARFCDEIKANSPLECNRCEPGYKLNENNACQVEHCINFDRKAWRCYQCTDSYIINSVVSLSNPMLIVQRCQDRFCRVFSRVDARCDHCMDQYTLVNGTCAFSNCEKAGPNACEQCVDGWAKNQNGNCVVYDCLEYVNPTKCRTCAAGRRLYKQRCITDNCVLRKQDGACSQCPIQTFVHPKFTQFCVVDFCSQIDESSGDCIQCIPNYGLDNKGKCISTLCLSYQSKKGFENPQCTKCADGYQPKDAGCIASKLYCQTYIFEQGRCEKCAEGYEFAPNNTTICNLKKCKELQPKSTYSRCKKCNLGYNLTNYDNGTQKCVPSNCSAFKDDQCSECVVGFNLFVDICLADNCQVYNEIGFCSRCYDGFFVNSTTLTCQRDKCLQDSKQGCKKCEKGYYPETSNSATKGLCRPYGCEEVQFNDRNQNTTASIKCMKCLAGFTSMPDMEMCVASDCYSLDQATGACKQCRNGFAVSPDGKCNLVRNNGYCPPRRYPNINFICQPIKAANCLSANPKNTVQCYKCEPDYYLRGTTCINLARCLVKNEYYGCLKCQLGYKPNQIGECENSVPNCISYDPNTGECQQCGNGFQIVLYPSKACQQVPEFCLRLDPWGKCEQCRLPNRVLTADKQCLLQTNNCQQYEYRSGLCVKCSAGFYLNGDQNFPMCLQNTENCESALETGECKKCLNNTVLSSGRCYPPINECMAYNMGRCSRCQVGWYVDSSQVHCRELPRYCNKVILNTDGVCQECKFGFASANGVCVRIIEFCVAYDEQTAKCVSCAKGYSPNASQTLCLLGYV